MKIRYGAAFAAALLLQICTSARAETIQINFDAGASSVSTGVFVYDVLLTSASFLKGGGAENRAILFDFPGFVSSTFVADSDLTTAGFTVAKTDEATTSSSLYAFTSPTDTGVMNVRLEFSKAGAGDFSGDPSGQSLGTLTLVSSITGGYETVLRRVFSLDYNTSTTEEQRSLNSAVIPVPLPMAAWAGMTLMGLITGHKLRQSRRLQA